MCIYILCIYKKCIYSVLKNCTVHSADSDPISSPQNPLEMIIEPKITKPEETDHCQV